MEFTFWLLRFLGNYILTGRKGERPYLVILAHKTLLAIDL